MPFHPDFSGHRAHPRLGEYTGRVARLFRGDEEVGALLVRLDAEALKVSGHLWWQRWSQPKDTLDLWILLDGSFTDDYVTADFVERELQDWQAGNFRLCGELLNLVWTSREESAHIRRTQFGDEG